MMKRLLFVVALFVLTSCGSGSTTYENGWTVIRLAPCERIVGFANIDRPVYEVMTEPNEKPRVLENRGTYVRYIENTDPCPTPVVASPEPKSCK